jgi:hypothetical protein
MSERYIISRGELLELLEAQYRLAALELGGVDNWQWYGEANCDFLDEYVNENKVFLTEEMDKEAAEEYLEDFDFIDIAEFEIGSYVRIEE